MNKPGCHRTGLDAHFGGGTSMLRNASRNWPGIGGADTAPEPLALLVDNADRGRLLRYVQPNIMRHRNLRWCKSPGKMPGSRHYRLLGFEPRLPEVHRCCRDRPVGVGSWTVLDRVQEWRCKSKVNDADQNIAGNVEEGEGHRKQRQGERVTTAAAALRSAGRGGRPRIAASRRGGTQGGPVAKFFCARFVGESRSAEPALTQS